MLQRPRSVPVRPAVGAHELLDLAEEPLRSFGLKLRADAERPVRWEMFELLRSAFAANSPVRLDYVKTGPGAGEIIRVANS